MECGSWLPALGIGATNPKTRNGNINSGNKAFTKIDLHKAGLDAISHYSWST